MYPLKSDVCQNVPLRSDFHHIPHADETVWNLDLIKHAERLGIYIPRAISVYSYNIASVFLRNWNARVGELCHEMET